MIHRLTEIVNQRRGKYILISILNQILHFLNWKFATLEAKNTSHLPLWQSISKTFKWISLTKIQYYPCRAIRGSEKSIKKKSPSVACTTSIIALCCNIENEGTIHFVFPRYFVVGIKCSVFTSKITQQSIPEKIDASNEVHSRCLSIIRFAANSILNAFLIRTHNAIYRVTRPTCKEITRARSIEGYSSIIPYS